MSWKAEFEKLYSEASEGETGKLMQLADKMLRLLKTNGQSNAVKLSNGCVGVRPHNRGGKLLSPVDVHAKVVAICKAGFASTYCGPDKAVCFEVHPTTGHIQEAMARLSDASALFPKMDKSLIKVGSVGCSHLVQFLNCVNAGVPTDEVSLCRPAEKHISKSVLVDEDAVFGMACDECLTWIVINGQIDEAYPRLPELLAKALNVEHHIARGETWAEQLVAIANRAADSKGSSVNWTAIAKAQAKSQPPCLNDIGAHVKLCQVYSGGRNMSFMKELSEFLRIELPLGRRQVSTHWAAPDSADA